MKKKKKWIYDILLVIAGCVFLFSAFKVGTLLYQYHLQDQEKAKLVKIAGVPKNPDEKEFTIDWERLQSINPQIMAWILIPDTDISYPVVQGRDNSYYLTHSAELKTLYSGAIFLDAGAHSNFSDRNTIIYGHNVRHGSMFAELEKFKDKSFFAAHPYVYIFTPDKSYRCEVISFYTTKDTSASYQTQFTSDEDFQKYISLVEGLSKYPAAAKADTTDHILTLSTCSYEDGGRASDLRYLLQTKLVEFHGKYMIKNK